MTPHEAADVGVKSDRLLAEIDRLKKKAAAANIGRAEAQIAAKKLDEKVHQLSNANWWLERKIKKLEQSNMRLYERLYKRSRWGKFVALIRATLTPRGEGD